MYWRVTPEASTNSAVESVLETSVSKFSVSFARFYGVFGPFSTASCGTWKPKFQNFQTILRRGRAALARPGRPTEDPRVPLMDG
jgi:hypothetical protein